MTSKNLRFDTVEEKEAAEDAAKLDKRSLNSFILIAIKEKIANDKVKKEVL